MADEPTFVFVKLNHRLMPAERTDVFEDPLQERLEATGLGEVTGGGTAQASDGEIAWCGIDVELHGDVEAGVRLLVETLEDLGAPNGSELQIDEGGEEPRVVPFGVVEGIALYLGGQPLADDVVAFTAEIDRLCEGLGQVAARWHGAEETGVYVFGDSAAELLRRIQPLLATHPLCPGARVVKIA